LAARRQLGEKAITRESELVVQAVATSVDLPLANNQYADLQLLIDSRLAEDIKVGDNRLQWLVVFDSTGTPVARTKAAPEKDALAELERRLADGIKTGDVVHAQAGTPT